MCLATSMLDFLYREQIKMNDHCFMGFVKTDLLHLTFRYYAIYSICESSMSSQERLAFYAVGWLEDFMNFDIDISP